ncbi:MAG: glycogen/starch synthase [Bacteroidia bacterium]
MSEQKLRVLYVSQEINPFLSETNLSEIVKNVAQSVQEYGKEIRVFMPRFGCINERRHQLHEVIRLSGMNLIINDTDHPLIIKVASIPQAKMQVYFIDNEKFFKRKEIVCDTKNILFEDNDERSIFFCRGVLETVKKLGWTPDVIHCNGWMTAMMPMYIKKFYANDPHFNEAKVVFSVYNNAFEGSLNPKLPSKLSFDGFDANDTKLLKDPSYENLCKTAIKFSDGVIFEEKTTSKSLQKFATDNDKPTLMHAAGENLAKIYSDFYEQVLETNNALA